MSHLVRRIWVLLPLVAAVPLVAVEKPPAELPAPKGYVCGKAAKPPVIDGKLDDAAWQAAAWTDDFVDIEGDGKPKPAHRTRAKMVWDDAGLYIAAEITEPHVWATLTDHDAVIFHDPDFEVFLDPDGDNHLYGELELNAKNTTWDLLLSKPYRDGGRAINAWEITGLKTAVRVNGTLNDPSDTDTGWTVEILWPWVGLDELAHKVAPPKAGDRWRINFSRVEWDVTVQGGKYGKVPDRKEHNWVWSPQGAIDMHRPERWGYLQFADDPDKVKYAPDPAQAVKDRLTAAYYAQRVYRETHGRLAPSAAALGLPDSPLGLPEFEVTRHGYEARLVAPKAAGGKTWTITQDSRLWGE